MHEEGTVAGDSLTEDNFDEFEDFRARSYSGGFGCEPMNKYHRARTKYVESNPTLSTHCSTAENDVENKRHPRDRGRQEVSIENAKCEEKETPKKGVLGSWHKSRSVHADLRKENGGTETHRSSFSQRPSSLRHIRRIHASLEEDWSPNDPMRPRVFSLPTRNSQKLPAATGNPGCSALNSASTRTIEASPSIRSFTITSKGLKKNYVKPRADSFNSDSDHGRHRGRCNSRASSLSVASTGSHSSCQSLDIDNVTSCPTYHVEVLGSDGVGKSAIITHFMENPDTVPSFGKRY